jgi:hypothetical protein
MKSKIIKLDNGELAVQIPQELVDDGLFLPGDEVDMFINKHKVIELRNLSCPVLQVSRFRRNLNGIMRNINNPNHHLRRVLMKRKAKVICWCVPHDQSLNPAFLLETERGITKAKETHNGE